MNLDPTATQSVSRKSEDCTGKTPDLVPKSSSRFLSPHHFPLQVCQHD
jgi:hypothetical protein